MPELPEVESLRRELEPALIGRRITTVTIRRRDVITDPQAGRVTRSKLLEGQTIQRLARHGKNLFIIADAPHPTHHQSPAAVRVHLGMSGNLRLKARPLPPHSHVTWRLDDGTSLTFVDPRRFGHLWPWPGHVTPTTLGPDALTITPPALYAACCKTQRFLKAVLLDQRVLAGLGNIYVDELLFAERLHPELVAATLDQRAVERLVLTMRRILNGAIRAGGSTLRDYRSATGEPGGYASRHEVYGKYGQSCPNCAGLLSRLVIAGRTSTFCPQCQPKPSGTNRVRGNGSRDMLR